MSGLDPDLAVAPRESRVLSVPPPAQPRSRVGLLPVLAGGLVAAAGLGAAWLLWRGVEGLARAAVRWPSVPLLVLAVAAGLGGWLWRRRGLARGRAARLGVLHRLWVDLDGLWGMADGRGREAPELLPLLEPATAPHLPAALRERLAGTDALLRQLGAVLPRAGSGAPGGLGLGGLALGGEQRLRQALVRGAMQAMLEDVAVVAPGAAASAVPGIAAVQEGLRRARAARLEVTVRVIAGAAAAETDEAVVLCWRGGAVEEAGVLVLGEWGATAQGLRP